MKPISSISHEIDFEQGTKKYVENLAKVLRNISFGTGNTDQAKNIDVAHVSGVTDPIANTNKEFDHSLGRVPTGYLVAGLDGAGIIYNGSTAWTSTKISLRCNAASVTFRILVF